MAKKKKMKSAQPKKKPNNDEAPSLKDYLDNSVLSQLQDKKNELKKVEEKKKEEELERKREERRLREKNKSFEELLNESDMDWEKFK